MELKEGLVNNKVRFAVLSFFLAQGLCFSSWASRIPDIKEYFGVKYALDLGLLLLMIPIGKFVAIPLAGYLVSKLGSKTMVQVSVLGYALSLFSTGLVTNIYLLGVCLFCFGVFWNMCDISLNTQAIGVERLHGKPLMASFHGGWSLAACLGALIGFIMIVLEVNPLIHFSIIGIMISLIVLISRGYLQPDALIKEEKQEDTQIASKTSRFKMPEKLLLQLGLVGLFALIIESAMFDWSGIYFESVLHVPKSLQIGFLVFMVMMTVGRFLANYAYRIFGKKRVLQIAGSLIFLGFFISAFLGEQIDSMIVKVIVNSLGFMLVGLGISCMVPAIYSFVGAKSKTPLGIALSILSSISFIGSLIAPILIGAISQAFNIKYAYLLVGALGLCIVILVSSLNAFNVDKE